MNDDDVFQELLDRLRAGDESHHLEAKRGSAVDTSVLETVCAFANEPGLGGGDILLGVVRDEEALFPDYEVVGVADPDKVQSDLSTQCAQMFNVAIRPRVLSSQSNGKTVLVARIAEAQPGEKPIYFKNKGLPKGAFRRIASTDQVCTEDDLSVLFQSRGHKAYEETVLEDLEWDQDLSPEAIESYRTRRGKANPTAAELTWPADELLYALGAVSKKEGRLVPTVCGLICFGKEQALRRVSPMVRVDYIRVPGKVWVEDPDHRFEVVEMRGPLLSMIPRVITTILDDIPRSFAMEDGIYRKDVPLIPELVVREAVVNALMHRSYRTKQPVQILRYSNRLEIRNPGCSLKPDDQLGDAGSVNRNELIATILHECNLAETKGSGIRVMKELMDRANLSLPFFESDRASDTFVLTLLTHHFMTPGDLTWLEQFKAHDLSGEEAKALVFLKEVGAISNSAYRDINKVETLQASMHLRRLRNLGLLEQKGKGAATYYQAGSVFRASLEKDALSANLHVVSPNQGSESPNLDALSPNRQSLLPLLPDSLVANLNGIGKRASTDTMETTIEEICQVQAFEKVEIAALIDRNEEYTGDYLRRLVLAGRLKMTMPETPNHPHQKYQATKGSQP